MKRQLFVACVLASLAASAQYQNTNSPLDGRNFGVVMDHPDQQKVVVKPDIPYLTTAAGSSLKLDVFQPPRLKSGEKRPVVVFLNAIGDEGKAIDALRKALELGYGSKSQFDSDPDLMSVRGEERYKKLFSQPN